MGDVLHALPAVAALREREPDAEIDWVVDPRWAPLLVDGQGRGPVVSRVYLAETKLWSRAPLSWATAHSVLALRTEIRARSYQATVDLQGTLRSAAIGRFARAKQFAGYADPREGAARLLYRRLIARRAAHVVEQGAALLGDTLELDLKPVTPPLPLRMGAETWAERQFTDSAGGRPAVLLVPTAGWGAKQWPAEHFAALARTLTAQGYAVLVNATGKDDPVAAQVIASSGGRGQLLVCDVARLIAMERRVSLVIGGDTGPVHLAAALGTPVVALFGPTDPARNGPWGPNPVWVLRDPGSVTSHKRVASTEPGLARLSVDEVLQASATALGRPRASDARPAAGRLKN